MKCPACSRDNNMVYDSRDSTTEGDSIRRRRKCLQKKCGHRWTTYEIATDMLPSQSEGAKEKRLVHKIFELIQTEYDFEEMGE